MNGLKYIIAPSPGIRIPNLTPRYVFVSQAAGVIHKAPCLIVPDRRVLGAIPEVASATANQVWGAQAVAAAFLATGALEMKGASPVSALTAVTQPLASASTGRYAPNLWPERNKNACR